MRDCGRGGKWWEKIAPIEHGEHRAQHDHADGQAQDPTRHVVLEDVVRDALRLADFSSAFATRMRSLPLTRVRTLAAALILA